jgi:hypothetical protein
MEISLAFGLVLIVLGVGTTFFNEQVLRFIIARQRYQWVKDLLGSDLYSLFFFLGGVGFIVAGGLIIFLWAYQS